MNITTPDLLYSSGAFIGIISFLIRDILWLRCVYALASTAYIVSAIYFNVWIMLIWNGLTLIINLVQICILILERKPIILPDHLKRIYLLAFQTMKPKEFLYFYKIGQAIQIKDQQVIEQGIQINKLFFLVDGSIVVKKNNSQIACLRPGSFIGEMNFLTGQPTSASIFAEGDVELLTWNKRDLTKLQSSKSQIYIKFQSILGMDLIRKLLH